MSRSLRAAWYRRPRPAILNLVLQGQYQEAQAMFERLLALANDVGLLAEEYDPAGQHQLGNFPQAFSHLALINSARNLDMRPRTGWYQLPGQMTGPGRERMCGRSGGVSAECTESRRHAKLNTRPHSIKNPRCSFVQNDQQAMAAPSHGDKHRSDRPHPGNNLPLLFLCRTWPGVPP
jgi:hypothetical protein